MLEDIKILIGPAADGKEEVIQQLLHIATDDAISKTGCQDTFYLQSVIKQMVVFLFNRLGSEGLTKEDYAGLSYTYSDDYPEYILSALDTIKTSQKGKGGFKILW